MKDNHKRRLIHREDLDELNEYYVQHHMERERAKMAWLPAVIVWSVVIGFFAWLIQDAFFPMHYWLVGWLILLVGSKLMVGFDIGVRVK